MNPRVFAKFSVHLFQDNKYLIILRDYRSLGYERKKQFVADDVNWPEIEKVNRSDPSRPTAWSGRHLFLLQPGGVNEASITILPLLFTKL